MTPGHKLQMGQMIPNEKKWDPAPSESSGHVQHFAAPPPAPALPERLLRLGVLADAEAGGSHGWPRGSATPGGKRGIPFM